MANNDHSQGRYWRLYDIECPQVFARNPEPAFVGRDGRPLYEAVPLSFLDPSRHVDVLCSYTYPPPQGVVEPHYLPTPEYLPVADHMDPYQRHLSCCDAGNARQGVIPLEEVNLCSSVPVPRCTYGAGVRHGGFFYDACGRPVFIPADSAQLADQAPDAEPTPLTRVELYVPLCCQKSVRTVQRNLGALSGVERVFLDQVDKKVVVTGRDLCPHTLLRHAHVKHKPKHSSSLWADRPSR